MKNIPIILSLPFVMLCPSCMTAPASVDTVKLEDAVIAAAKSARKAGAKSLTYEATVVTTAGGAASVVVPIGVVAPQFGASLQRAVGSKVTINVDVQPTANKPTSGIQYKLNTSTLEAVEIQ